MSEEDIMLALNEALQKPGEPISICFSELLTPVAPGRYYLPGTTCPQPQVLPAPDKRLSGAGGPVQIGSRKSSSDFGYAPKNAKTDPFQPGTNTHTKQMIF